MPCKICSVETDKNFCSKSCQVKHRNLVNPQKRKPKNICPQCNEETSNPKFCSTKCSALFHNPKKEYFCCGCKILLSIGWINSNKYCSNCRINSSINKNFRDWSQVSIEEHFKNLPNFQANSRIRNLARALFRKLKPDVKCCQHCSYSKHIEICHKKGISTFDRQTPISVVNDISNLIALCPNCHWEFDNNLLTLKSEALELN